MIVAMVLRSKVTGCGNCELYSGSQTKFYLCGRHAMSIRKLITKSRMPKIGGLIVLLSAFTVRAHGIAEEGFPAGCWSKQSFDGRTVSGLWLCFRENGELHGVDVDRGHGVDFGGRWQITEEDKLRLTIGDETDTCSLIWRKGRDKLTLFACNTSNFDGIFEQVRD